MNHIYRIVWNATLGAWTAVQETAKSHGKTSSGKAARAASQNSLALRFAFTLVASAVLLVSGQAMADVFGNQYPVPAGNGDNYCYYDATSQSVICGDGTTKVIGSFKVKNKDTGEEVFVPAQAIAIGHEAETRGRYALAIGVKAKAGSPSVPEGNSWGMAIGYNAEAGGWGSPIAIGTESKTLGESPVAIGDFATAEGDGAVAIGGKRRGKHLPGQSTYAKGKGTLALGHLATVSASGTGGDVSHAIAIGSEAKVLGESKNAEQAIAIGLQANASDSRVIALGGKSEAKGQQSIAVGYDAKTVGEQSVAVGANVRATGNSSIAIGGDDLDKVASTKPANTIVAAPANDNATLNDTPAAATYKNLTGEFLVDYTGATPRWIRTEAGHGAAAVGIQAKASGDLATAFGTKAAASGVISTAVGVGANASLDNAVALGAGSSTKTNATQETTATVGSITYGAAAGQPGAFAGGANMHVGDQVSVGSANFERQIKHVAPGRIAADSTDAINGSQLHATQTVIGNVADTTAAHLGGGAAVQADGSISAPTYSINGSNYNDVGSALQAAAASGGGTHYYSVNSAETGADSNYNNDGATGSNALAAGVAASATEESALAVGHKAQATEKFTVAVGLDAQATASGAMALGNGAQAEGQDSVAHGKASKATGDFATAVGNAASAGLHATAVGNGAAASADYAIAFGTGSKALANGAAALGNDAKAEGWAAVAMGNGAQASQTGAVAIGEGAQAAHEHSVALGRDSATAAVDNTGRASATVGGITYSGFAADTPTSMVSVGTQRAERTITNVAAGRISATSTDAINGSQLHATQTVIGNVAGSVKDILGGGAAVQADGKLSMGNNIGGTGQNTIDAAIAAAHTAANAGWNLQANDGAASNVAPNDTVKVVDGKNTTVTLTDKTLKVDVVDAPTFTGKVTADGGLDVAGGDGLKVAANTNVNMGDNVVHGVKAGVEETDAVNMSQLRSASAALGGGAGLDPATGAFTAPSYVIKKTDGTSYAAVDNVGAALGNLNAEVVKPLSFAGDSGTNIDRTLGSTLNVKGGATGTLTDGNIGVVADSNSNTLNIKLAQNINLGAAGSVQTGNTTVNNAGITIAAANPVSLTAQGLNNGGNKISNVADGVADTDAVNFSQLQAVAAAADAAKTHYYSVNSTEQGAGSNYNNDGATGSNALAAGRKAKAAGANSVAVGNEASAGHNLSVAIGHAAQTRGKHALAIGAKAKAGTEASPAGADAGSWGTAIGYNAEAAGTASPLAIGTESKTVGGESPIAIGDWATADGTGAIAIGSKAGGGHVPGRSTYAKGVQTTALGYLAQATQQGALALGANADASLGNAVALGAGSLTNTDATQETQASVGDITYGAAAGQPGAFAGAANVAAGHQVSVGKAGMERQIKHVAPGAISATSTDAINGSQLHATQTVIGNVVGSVKGILGGNAVVGGDGKLSMSNIGGTGKSTIHEAIAAVNNTAGAGWSIGNGGATPVATVKPGARVDFVAGNSSTKVDVTHDTNGNSKVTVSAAPGALQYTGTNNAAGNNTPSADQFTPTNQVTLVGAAGNTGGVTINNVAPAELSAISKQAVNGSQLHAVGSSTAAALGGTSTFNPATGQVTAGLNVGGTTHTSVQDALNAINTTAGAGWNLQANDGPASNIAGANNTVKVVDGSNTKVTLNGTTLKVDVVDDPVFSGQVTANGGLAVANNLTLAAGTNVSMGGNIIHNVADGVADTDAANMGQLRAMSGNITNITNQIGAVDARVTDVANLVGDNTPDANGIRGTTTYDVDGQTTTDNPTILRTLYRMNRFGIKYHHSHDTGEAPLLEGARTNDSSAAAPGSTALGVNAIIDKEAESATVAGHRARALSRAKRSVAIGHEATAGGESSVAVGDHAQALADRAISIGTGNIVRGENSGALGDPSIINAANSYSVGNHNTIAAGSDNAFVFGNNVTATAANSVNLGTGAAAQTAATPQTAGMTDYSVGIVNGVAYNYAGGTPAGVVTVGSVGQERRVQNVAAGLVSPTSTDAINGSQLYQTTATINNLSNKIDANHDKAMGGVASAMASAGLPQPYLPGKSMVAMGAATYQGRTALALGVSTISDNGRWVMKGSLNTHNHGTLGANIGVGYQW